MFRKILDAGRRLLEKMKLVKNVKRVADIADNTVNDKTYDFMEIWRMAYKGYVPAWHDYHITLVDGNRHKRKRITMKMAKVVANKMAQLCFNERVTIGVSNEADNDYLQSVLKNNNFNVQFQKYLEYMFAMGGMAIRLYHDGEKIRFAYTNADCFVPLTYNGREVTEGIFVNQTRKGNKWYNLLEFHTWEGNEYVIRNELYESHNETEIGLAVPLNYLYAELEGETRFSGLTRSLFVYFRPNIANNVDFYSDLGVSIYADAMDTLRTIDVAFDSFRREIELGKKRIVVPTQFLKTGVERNTGELKQYFDTQDEVYQGFYMGDEGNQIQDLSVSMRIDEHIDAINAALRILAMQTGFEAGTFTFDGRSMKTATEVISEDSETYQTRSSHLTVIEQCMHNLILSVFELSAVLGIHRAGAFDISINFDDAIVTDKNGDADYWLKLLMSGVVSKQYAMQKILKISESEAAAMIEQQNEEQQPSAELDLTAGLE